MAPTTMRAYIYNQTTGGLDANLHFSPNAPLPPSASSLSKDQVLVRVLSSALNPVDYKFPEIPYLGSLMVGCPASPSIDYAGRVVASGPGSSVKEGQLVFGRLASPSKFGTLAEYTIAPKDGCVPVPDGVKVEDASSIGTAGLTAYQCIVPNVKSGDRVFINGGSGGTGSFGIQIAKAMGCKVTTTCSTANVGLCKSLGADEVIDYKKVGILQALKDMPKFDAVVDNVGASNELYWKSHEYTKPNVKFVQVGAAISFGFVKETMTRMMLPTVLGGGQRPYQFLGTQNNPDDFAKLAQWMKEGKVKAVIDEQFAMEGDGPVKAFQKMKSGRSKGKIVVRGFPE